MQTLSKLEVFEREVIAKYQVYNSIFLTLPFDTIYDTGSMLPLFAKACEKGLAERLHPAQIVHTFFQTYLPQADESQRIDWLFRFIQFVERQIVLFDALEDAGFAQFNNLDGAGSLRSIQDRNLAAETQVLLENFLADFAIRPVLTAHPTQFYPGPVLGIITDLTEAIKRGDLFEIKQRLAQLGVTPFIKKEKPTPFDEAISLIWYLENVFYSAAGGIAYELEQQFGRAEVLRLGFWPGGDRDGNPFVTAEITQQVADRLRTSILKCYYQDLRRLKRKLTFPQVIDRVMELENRLYRSVFYSKGEVYITPSQMEQALEELLERVETNYQGLYANEIRALQVKLRIFGFYFASLDIRQNARVHRSIWKQFIQLHPSLPTREELISADFNQLPLGLNAMEWTDPVERETVNSWFTMREIQTRNGEAAAHRYIISNNEGAEDVLLAMALFHTAGIEYDSIDFVPLLESVDDLLCAAEMFEQLYAHPSYAAHLQKRNQTQTVMLGYSDGTKDGGYLMANWSIYQAKEEISRISQQYGIRVVFFDGRGGPPARGGGKTHQFYAGLGESIANREIQITVQGQTISSNFGTVESCRFNLENWITAGIRNRVLEPVKDNMLASDIDLIEELSRIGYAHYAALKAHPKFLPYLEQMSTLPYYAKTNIGSRPAKRNSDSRLDFNDLRAIPFVGSWSQLKQNVPGYYGVGTALKSFDDQGKWEQVKQFYKRSLYFRTLLENSMMSLAKCNFALTAYMESDPEFGEFWQLLFAEYQLTKQYLLKLAGHTHLMENYPEGRASVEMRERIVLPLLVIQQFALSRLRQIATGDTPYAQWEAVYQKIVTRSLFGNTNASRNSA